LHTHNFLSQGYCFTCGDSRCAEMGYHAIDYKPEIDRYQRTNVRFYLSTGDGPDTFCQYHYLVDIKLANPTEAERWVQGFLKINLYGTKNEVTELDLTPEGSISLYHGNSARYMLGFYSDLGDVGIANVNWKYDHDLNLLKLTKTCILLCSDTLFVDRLEISSAHECKKRKKLVEAR
jgi:hypothetical protein